MQKLKQQVDRIIGSGFIHVFAANIVSQLVAFCGSIVYVRLMGRHDFGLYAFAYNIISFFLLVNGFGAPSGVLQFVSRARDDITRLSYLKYSITIGILFNCLLSLAIFAYAMFATLPLPGVRNLLIAMAFFPIGRLYIDVFQAYLRATQNNELLAKFAISANLILLLGNTIGIWWAGLFGFVLSTYIAYVVIIILSTFVYKLPNVFTLKAISLNTREFISYSMYATIGNAFAQLVFILDILLLSYIVKSVNIVAAYKVATVIPFAINFIPGVVSTFFYPIFAQNAANLVYVKELRRRVMRGMFLFSFSVSMFLIICAKPLILTIFGPEYQASILPFQILAFGFWIVATFRNINGNILASLGKAKFAMWINVVVVSVNLVLTYFLVVGYGIIGAALGVVVVYILASIIATLALNQILTVENN